MKTKIAYHLKRAATGCIGLSVAIMCLTSCSAADKDREDAEAGTPIDSTVIGIDTNAVDVRNDVEMSDPQKQTLPGRDTTNTDEPK